MAADDALLAHPQVAHVEVEVEAGRGAADDDLAERLDGEDAGRERGHADVLEDDVGLLAEDLLDALGEAARLAEARTVRTQTGVSPDRSGSPASQPSGSVPCRTRWNSAASSGCAAR